MRKHAPLFTKAELRDMALSDRLIDIEEDSFKHGAGAGYSKTVGGVKNGTTSRPVKVQADRTAT